MAQSVVIKSRIRLRDFNPAEDFGMNKEKTRIETLQLTERIGGLQAKLYANTGRALIVVFQGMDASGKDGATRGLLEFVNPGGVEVANFKAPSDEERAHDFLWRVHHAVPRYGRIGVFNRSHYEDVLVARVMKIVDKTVWEPRFKQINRFELNLHESGYIWLKFFLHVSHAEQAIRLQARLSDPTKNWKFEGADLEMRDRWDDFVKAYEDAISRCSPRHARWHVVPADKKWVRDYIIARQVCETLESMQLTWPKPREDLSKYTVK